MDKISDQKVRMEMRTDVGGGTLGGVSRGSQRIGKTLKTSPVGSAASKKSAASKGEVVFERHFTCELAS